MEPLAGWIAPDEGALFVVTGPSGVGKSTLIRAAMGRIPGMAFSVSATTRAPRQGEVHGQDYLFLSQEEFHAHVERREFLEHATVYGRSYGTLRQPVEAAVRAGLSIVLDIDVQGARSVRRSWDGAVTIMILPPDVATLEARLRARGTDDDGTIARRMEEVTLQLGGVDEYDYLVVNDDLTTAHAVFQGVVLAELSRRGRRQSLVERVQRELEARR